LSLSQQTTIKTQQQLPTLNIDFDLKFGNWATQTRVGNRIPNPGLELNSLCLVRVLVHGYGRNYKPLLLLHSTFY